MNQRAACSREGGREALRQRLVEFSDSQRRVLSDALAELAAA